MFGFILPVELEGQRVILNVERKRRAFFRDAFNASIPALVYTADSHYRMIIRRHVLLDDLDSSIS